MDFVLIFKSGFGSGDTGMVDIWYRKQQQQHHHCAGLSLLLNKKKTRDWDIMIVNPPFEIHAIPGSFNVSIIT